jgi:hypothetical protein
MPNRLVLPQNDRRQHGLKTKSCSETARGPAAAGGRGRELATRVRATAQRDNPTRSAV